MPSPRHPLTAAALIRPACATDAGDIACILVSAIEERSARNERAAATIAASVAAQLMDLRYRYLIAVAAGEAAGLAAVFERKHLLHLAVLPDWRERGLERRLFVTALAALVDDERNAFTIEAAPALYAAVRRFGYVESGPPCEHHGRPALPMRRASGRPLSSTPAAGHSSPQQASWE